MAFIRIIILLALYNLLQQPAYAANNTYFDWMDSTLDGITNFIPKCIQVPAVTSMHYNNTSLNINDNHWVATGIYVEEDKLLQMEWSLNQVQLRPQKYKVLYRIDPRFTVPQVFIQKHNPQSDSYISDFHRYKDGLLMQYQQSPAIDFNNRINDYSNYFNFVDRSKIPIKKGDVVNITLDTTGSYFGSKSEMHDDLGTSDDLSVIYTSSALPDNKIIYANADQFCAGGIGQKSSEYQINCPQPGNYWDINRTWHTFEGRMSNHAFDIQKQVLNSCSDDFLGRDQPVFCYYDQGRGMTLSINGKVIKNTTEKFTQSPYTGKSFFYHEAMNDGQLDFSTTWDIRGMYNGYSQFMQDWGSFGDYLTLQEQFDTIKTNLTMNFLHFGRYLLDIEVGSATALAQDYSNNVKVEYLITKSGVPDASMKGRTINQVYRGNANSSGYLFLRTRSSDNNLTGAIQVKTTNYTGSTWFSDTVYGQLVKPLRAKFDELSKKFYTKLITNVALQNIAHIMLTIYIIIYGLLFLAGATQITINDIIVRVLKIAVVLTLFSPTSWFFFNDNLFDVFVRGSDSLLTSVIGLTSRDGNIFGFVDPIFDKYTNSTIWGLLLIQLLQIHTGLTFLAIITIYGILMYCRAVLEIIVSYCIAFLGLAVMISLAPFFITLILFERTKSMFDNWLSIMFSYMIQPTILLVFFLLIDQIMEDQLTQTLLTACWGTLIPIKIALDLHHIYIPISFSFSLPFLPSIPFYIPQITPIYNVSDLFKLNGTYMMIAKASLLFFVWAKLARSLVEYVTLITQHLTNVHAIHHSGQLQQEKNPIKNIINDIQGLTSPASNMISGVGKFAQEKIIQQKIRHRNSSAGTEHEDLPTSNKLNHQKDQDIEPASTKATPATDHAQVGASTSTNSSPQNNNTDVQQRNADDQQR